MGKEQKGIDWVKDRVDRECRKWEKKTGEERSGIPS